MVLTQIATYNIHRLTKFGFRFKRRLESENPLANPRLVNFVSTNECIHVTLQADPIFHESYSIITSTWPRILAVFHI